MVDIHFTRWLTSSTGRKITTGVFVGWILIASILAGDYMSDVQQGVIPTPSLDKMVLATTCTLLIVFVLTAVTILAWCLPTAPKRLLDHLNEEILHARLTRRLHGPCASTVADDLLRDVRKDAEQAALYCLQQKRYVTGDRFLRVMDKVAQELNYAHATPPNKGVPA